MKEKVDCVVVSYSVCTFINSFEMLTSFLSQLRKFFKEDGFMIISDFSHSNMPCDNFSIGWYNDTYEEFNPPKAFEPFKFFIATEPDHVYQIFNITAYSMFQAIHKVGYSQIEYIRIYSDPLYINDLAIIKYLKDTPSPDYIFKVKL
jgi:hypothetical protein